MPDEKGRPSEEPSAGGTRVVVSMVPDPAYWQSLGQFIEAFSMAEVGLFVYLPVCSGIPNRIARALVAGFHADQLITAIRNVWQISPPDKDVKATVDPALVQLKEISKIRNSVAHYVSLVVSNKGRITSKITRALTEREEHLQEYRISPEIMSAMIADLEKIGQHITYGTLVTLEPNVSRDEQRRGLPALAASWQYKPHKHQPQSPPRRRSRDRT
jgi:hypothetical protein